MVGGAGQRGATDRVGADGTMRKRELQTDDAGLPWLQGLLCLTSLVECVARHEEDWDLAELVEWCAHAVARAWR